MIFIGIDPGITGAVAVIAGSRIVFHDSPVVQVKVGERIKNQIDPHGCTMLLKRYLDPGQDVMAIIEKVAPMPSFKVQRKGEEPKGQSMGATSAFNFGRDFGLWIGVCAALGISYELVPPQTWKRKMMAGISGGKDAGRMRALQLYPQVSGELARKKDHGRADALLLARFGQSTWAPGTVPETPPAMATSLF